jgi:LmbE family N-acetylglucosaminyl deacetylase
MKEKRNSLVAAVPLAGLLLALAFYASSSTRGYAQDFSIHTAHPAPRAATASVLAPAAEMQGIDGKKMSVPEGLRLIVFAPHPDDEALAAAGLIQRVWKKGGEVRVVFMTNGDGYVDALRRETGERNIAPSRFVEYGHKRHLEAVDALKAVGLEPHHGIFLGFPDGGIDDLWSHHWPSTAPYTSPHTRADRPPYPYAARHGVHYSGSHLELEIGRILRDFRPDWLVVPDLRDFHPDHYATGIFVLEAIRKMQEDAKPLQPTVLTYLVHYRNYPGSDAWLQEINKAGIGNGSISRGILPPMNWLALPLTQEEIAVKERVLMEHESQVPVLGKFFKLFLCRTEWFGQLDNVRIPLLNREYITLSKRPSK